MKKGIKICLIVIGVIIVLGLIFFAVDYNRAKNNEKPIFCFNVATYRDGGTIEYMGLGYKVIDFHSLSGYDEVKIGSWFMQYEDFEEEYSKFDNEFEETHTSIKDVPQEYPMEQAINDGCVVLSDQIYNEDKLDSFVENTKIDSKDRKSDFIRIIQYTNEGDAIITDLEYKADVGYIATKDNTRDAFGADTTVVTNDDIPAKFYTIELKENEYSVDIVLQLTSEIENDSDVEPYKPITVTNYTLN